MELLFPEYFQSISRIFPYHGKHFHTVELDKTMEIGFSNLFLQYFQNISILWERSIFFQCFREGNGNWTSFLRNTLQHITKLGFTNQVHFKRHSFKTVIYEGFVVLLQRSTSTIFHCRCSSASWTEPWIWTLILNCELELSTGMQTHKIVSK